MVYTQQLADRATAWLALPLNDKRSGAGLIELGSLWAAIQGLPPVECRQCQYSDRARAVAAYPREFLQFSTSAAMSDTQTTSSYQLAPAYASQTLTHEDFAGPLTAENLTDEAAEFFISKGFGHAFLKRTDSGVEAVDASTDSADETDAEQPEPTEREQEQLAKYEQALAQVQVEQTAHAATKQTLEAEKQQYESLLPKYNEANGARVKAENALKSEKTAHSETKKQLAKVQKQLAEAQKQLADLASKAQPAAPATDPVPADSAAS